MTLGGACDHSDPTPDLPPPPSSAADYSNGGGKASAREGGRNLVRFAHCLLLPPSSKRSDDPCGLIDADLLVDVDAGLIAAIDVANREGLSPDGGDEEKKEEVDEWGSICADDTVVETVDCRGGILSPGFIDVQINGAFGVDFSDPTLTPGQVRHVARKLTTQGVTSFCPTLISCSRDTYRKLIPTIGALGSLCEGGEYANSRTGEEEIGAEVLGLHLEGPFFAPAKRGAHPLSHIVDPSDGFPSVLDAYGLSDCPVDDGVRIVTLAPEREGALRASAGLAERGVVVAMGHTEATLGEAEAGVTAGGATLVTHLFNAMRPFHHREPGLVGILSSNGGLGCDNGNGGDSGGSSAAGEVAIPKKFRRPYWSVIADGIHVHPCAIRMARYTHPAGAVLVTDAMSAMGLGDGMHTLGSTVVETKGGRATVAGTDTLAGSVASMDHCVRCYRKFSSCGIAEALRCATLHPARVLGIDEKRGQLARGCHADLILLDRENLSIMGTWVKGRNVYESNFRHEKKRKRNRLETSMMV
mmetsp:Transcript_18607/g.53651  ORF Transcript_18607/g.53651 Transcript_18607/m.53651 type:complete len:528 (-) Transcript_18607:647-2230(-)